MEIQKSVSFHFHVSCCSWHYTNQEEVYCKLNFCPKPGKLEHFQQIVFRASASSVLSENGKDKKDNTVMCNVLEVSFAENGKNVFSWVQAHTCKCLYVWLCQQAYRTCLSTCTFGFVRLNQCLWACVCTREIASRERAAVCQHVNWKGFIFAALLPGRKRGSGHRCEVWLMDVLPW